MEVFKKKFFTLTILIFLFLNMNVFGQNEKDSGNILSEELKSKSAEYFKQEKFPEFLAYLNSLGGEGKQNFSLTFDYYSALAKSKYLDRLEEQEDWKNYYELVHKFDAEIIGLTEQAKTQPLSDFSLQLQYLIWKAHLREEDDAADAAFTNLVDSAIKLTEEKHDPAVFKKLADLITQEGQVKQADKLFSAYRDYLLKSNAEPASISRLVEIADEYLKEGKIDTARVIYEQYIYIILKRYSKAEGQKSMVEIANKFREHGFWEAKDADFAENIYSIIEKNLGFDFLREPEIFSRGYNLEIIGDYQKSIDAYNHFIQRFKNSKFMDEVYTRLGIINFYQLRQPELAIGFFEKVKKDFPQSFYWPYCIYEAGLFYQWKKENEKAYGLYRLLIEKEGVFTELAKKRQEEIDSRLGMERNFRYPLDKLFEERESSPIELTLKAKPERCFVDEELRWSASAQDYSSGTVQPLFTYQWFGDTGTNAEPGNVTEFTTAYPGAGPKTVFFLASTGDSDNIICKTIWVHEIAINSPKKGQMFRVGEAVLFTAEILPPCLEIDNNLNYKWQIEGEENILNENMSFSHKFEKVGHYEGKLELTIGEAKGIKKISFDIVK